MIPYRIGLSKTKHKPQKGGQTVAYMPELSYKESPGLLAWKELVHSLSALCLFSLDIVAVVVIHFV